MPSSDQSIRNANKRLYHDVSISSPCCRIIDGTTTPRVILSAEREVDTDVVGSELRTRAIPSSDPIERSHRASDRSAYPSSERSISLRATSLNHQPMSGCRPLHATSDAIESYTVARCGRRQHHILLVPFSIDKIKLSTNIAYVFYFYYLFQLQSGEIAQSRPHVGHFSWESEKLTFSSSRGNLWRNFTFVFLQFN